VNGTGGLDLIPRWELGEHYLLDIRVGATDAPKDTPPPPAPDPAPDPPAGPDLA